MAARSDKFPWPPHYGHFDFFEARMKGHSKIAKLTARGAGIYELLRGDGTVLTIFICECYSFGAAEYVETQNALGKIDAIIINSQWCGFTSDAKRMARDQKVGLFRIKDFMAALYTKEPWAYLNADEKEEFKKNNWL